jgi:hypothetical protein
LLIRYACKSTAILSGCKRKIKKTCSLAENIVRVEAVEPEYDARYWDRIAGLDVRVGTEVPTRVRGRFVLKYGADFDTAAVAANDCGDSCGYEKP